MATIYFKDGAGNKHTVEVSEQVANELKQTRREIWRNDAYQKYHAPISLEELIEETLCDKQTDLTNIIPSSEELAEERERQVEKERLLYKLRKAFALLRDDHKEIVRLHIVENKTLSEIAEIFGIGAEAMKKRWQRILTHLKNLMKKI